jgi:tellurite resistance protein
MEAGERGSASRARALDLGLLRQAAKHLRGESLRDGTWFKKLIADHVKEHHKAISAATWDAVYPGLDAEARAERHIAKVAWKASAAGAVASLGASTGELLALVTEGLAAPVGVPAAMLSMGLEGSYTALLQVDLACDLASIYGVPFDPDDAGEIATLFAVALDVEARAPQKRTGAERVHTTEGEGLEARLIELEEGEVATRIGRKLIEDAVVRNIIPFAGIPVSARWNFIGTHRLGAKVNRYIRYRRALRRAYARIDCQRVADPMLLIEGAWILATSDGDPTHEEMLAIAALAEASGHGDSGDSRALADPPSDGTLRSRIDTSKARVEDEDEWLERVAKSPASSHDAILETLYLVAATDRELQTGERRILRRVGKALGRTVDFDRVEQICRHLADGKDLPSAATG